ncbi:PREDICTED: FIZZY-RELATED 2, partial [Prunus dulcis]
MAIKNLISSILNNYTLDGMNYPGWLRKVKLVLKMDEIDYVWTQAPPHIPPDQTATQEEITTFEKHAKHDSR